MWFGLSQSTKPCQGQVRRPGGTGSVLIYVYLAMPKPLPPLCSMIWPVV
jgi:hypothetical protein